MLSVESLKFGHSCQSYLIMIERKTETLDVIQFLLHEFYEEIVISLLCLKCAIHLVTKVKRQQNKRKQFIRTNTG